MPTVLDYDWQPLSALRPLLLAVEGMLEVTVSQLQDILLAKKKALMLEKRVVEHIRNTYAQRQSHLRLFRLQCERWKTEPLVAYQLQSLDKLEAVLTALEKMNQQILCILQVYEEDNRF